MSAVLGRYRVLKHLTSGGMADVLLGRSDGIEGFERHVVLKRIRSEHARDKRFISMFLDEARLAAGLHHQAIVQVFDIGEANGEYFFAMEYIHGEDLRTVLSAMAKTRTHMPLGFVCSIVAAAASGLHYAHERRDAKGKPLNIVHRDVSPSNILIGYDGSVKIVDFGIAKATLRQTETLAGSLKGKCSYMSPEQCKSDPIDRRSDVYGLGVLLYELATTSRLFKGDNEYLVMDAIVNGRIAMPQVRRPDLPNDLSTIIMRALATDPNRRYQTAEELRIDLEHFMATNDRTTSIATLAGYMKKVFGERSEPWLVESSDTDAAPSRPSWSENERHSARSILPRPVSAAETGPATKQLGWESRPLQAARANKLVWAAVPVCAIAVLAVWKLSASKDAPQAAAAQVATPAPRVVGAPATQQVETAESVTAPVAAVVPSAAGNAQPAAVAIAVPAHEEPAPVTLATTVRVDDAPADAKKAAAPKLAKKAAASVPAVAAAPTPPAPAAAPAPAPAAAPPTATTTTTATSPAAIIAALRPPTPAAAAPVAVPAVAAQPPSEVDAPISLLSNATVAAAASDHSAQLARCEGGAALHGEVAVSFQIDGTGKVVRSQLSSTIKNPKIAGCILRAVQTWKFPKPPSGSAKGVYSISYQ
ncbi:MAG TPA: protein kinase [Kofleriaceae bacterium]